MATRERPVARGARIGRQLRTGLGEELRQARIAVNLSQASLGKALGWSHNKVGRIERGQSLRVALDDLARAFAVCGMDLTARAYPLMSPMRDQAHLDVLARFRARISPLFGWATEVPLPNPGDLRRWDALIRADRKRFGVDCETRATDWQALERRIHHKERDGGVDLVILVLADTRSNRAFAREYAREIATSFPIDRRAAMAALEAGDDPGGNALVLV